MNKRPPVPTNDGPPSRQKVAVIALLGALLSGALAWHFVSAPSADNAPPHATTATAQDRPAPDPVPPRTAGVDDWPSDVALPAIDPDCAAHLSELDAQPMDMSAINALTLEVEEKLNDFARALEQSSDPYDRLIAIDLAWGRPQADKLARLSALKTALPNDPLVASALFEACAPFPDDANCARGAAQDHLLRADGDNGAVWLRIASRALAQDDIDAGFDALQRMVNTATHTSRVAQWAIAGERALRVAPNLTYTERIGYALNLGVRHAWPDYAPLSLTCFAQSTKSTAWADLCLEVAVALEENATDLLANAIGLGLQKRLYEQRGNAALASAAEQRGQAIKQLQADVYRWSAERRLMDHEAVMQGYFDAYNNGGERAAAEHLVRTAQTAAADGSHRPCYDPRILESISR